MRGGRGFHASGEAGRRGGVVDRSGSEADRSAGEALARPFRFRRPESVLVVVYTTALECLLLERVVPVGVWQSVTGSLEWGESPAEAAAREVREETGIDPRGLCDAGVANRFEIWPEWRRKYAPGVTENVEHLWYLELPARVPVVLNAEEHRAYRWFPLEEAIRAVASWTNREALERLSA